MAIITVCLLVLPAAATPPSAISMTFDRGTEQLAVTITHPVADPSTHYIRNVKVKVNNAIVIDTDYTSQPSKDTFTYSYQIPIRAGDTVRAIATCNLAGQGESVITIPTPSGTAPPALTSASSLPAPSPAPTPKASLGALSISALLIMGILAALKRDR